MCFMEELHVFFYSNVNTVSLRWQDFRVCIHWRENHISSLKWIQIFNIHELSSLWFLNRSTIYHLSYAFTLSITMNSFFIYLTVY